MFGEQLKGLRLTRNISQVQLASALNVSKQTVSNWENNNIMPSVDKLKDIAVFFSCTTDYLLELNENVFIIDIEELTNVQISHVQQIIKDLQISNRMIKKLQDDCRKV